MSDGPRKWFSVLQAALFLDVKPDALRKRLERHAVRAPDGVTEAVIDGITGRKFGSTWRVAFSERWLRCDEGSP
jgi:hypothetical protein